MRQKFDPISTMASYRLTAQRPKQAEIAQTQQRWQQATSLAKQAATFLRTNYGVETVILLSEKEAIARSL